ncbi:hypothetical protein ACJJTC_002522 [Scirpophaga incertulas]
MRAKTFFEFWYVQVRRPAFDGVRAPSPSACHGNHKHGVIDIEVRLFFLRVKGEVRFRFLEVPTYATAGTWVGRPALDSIWPGGAGRNTVSLHWEDLRQQASRRRFGAASDVLQAARPERDWAAGTRACVLRPISSPN